MEVRQVDGLLFSERMDVLRADRAGLEIDEVVACNLEAG